MIYFIPPDSYLDTIEESQKVFVWFLSSRVISQSDTNINCLKIGGEFESSVIIRVDVEKCQSLQYLIENPTVDLVLIICSGKILWQEKSPSKETIRLKMMECIDIRKEPELPLKPTRPPRLSKLNKYESFESPKVQSESPESNIITNNSGF